MKLFVSENRTKYKTSAEFALLCLAEYSGFDSRAFTISRDGYGKPWCSTADGEYYFSLSHTENVIMCAVDIHNIGLDCQIINKNYPSCRKIADRFFHGEECRLLGLSSSEDAYVDLFFEMWTKKEAYGKFVGRGLADGLTNFNSTEYTRNFIVAPYKDIKTAVYSENLTEYVLSDIVILS